MCFYLHNLHVCLQLVMYLLVMYFWAYLCFIYMMSKSSVLYQIYISANSVFLHNLWFTFAQFFCLIRNFIGQGVGPAQWPDANRYMECLILHLCEAFPTHKRAKGDLTLRWDLVMGCYMGIKTMVIEASDDKRKSAARDKASASGYQSANLVYVVSSVGFV